jgi:GAF domain-containing protein
MATTTKKAARKSKAKPRAAATADSVAKLKKTIAAQAREIRAGQEQQAATSEILRVIASSPTDLQPVLDVVAENAAKLCDANDAVIFRIDGDALQLATKYGPMPVTETRRPIIRGSPGGRAVIDRQTIHVHDSAAEVETEFPEYNHIQQRTGTRTALATPLLRKGVPIGVIFIRRTEVRPFTEKQIALLKTFADQAVIAIENGRLFKELDERNRQLTEALEQQTATSDILRVIASSPTDIQPVLDVVAENAAKLCDARDAVISRIDGEVLEQVAIYGAIPVPEPNRINRDSPVGRAIVDRKTIHIADLAAEVETEFPESKGRQQISGTRSMLVTPLLREGVPIGMIIIRRTEVRPFTAKQIKLLETFASQAVIAIENVRLFQELQARNRDLTEALEQQTATSEILRVIASSPTNLQPVFQTILDNAVRLCERKMAPCSDLMERSFGPLYGITFHLHCRPM